MLFMLIQKLPMVKGAAIETFQREHKATTKYSHQWKSEGHLYYFPQWQNGKSPNHLLVPLTGRKQPNTKG